MKLVTWHNYWHSDECIFTTVFKKKYVSPKNLRDSWLNCLNWRPPPPQQTTHSTYSSQCRLLRVMFCSVYLTHRIFRLYNRAYSSTVFTEVQLLLNKGKVFFLSSFGKLVSILLLRVTALKILKNTRISWLYVHIYVIGLMTLQSP